MELTTTAMPRGILHVIHGHGGGTEHHARSLIDASRGEYRHCLAVALGDAWQLEEHLAEGGMRAFDVARGAGEAWPAFLRRICAKFRVDLIHLHNLSGARDGIIAALEGLNTPFGYTAHDLNFACPTMLFLGADGRYCFEQTDAGVCRTCLRAQPHFAAVDIAEWRARHHALLRRAAFVIAPSRWVASALERYFPGLDVDVIPHGAPGVWAMASSEAAQDGTRGRTELATRAPIPLPDDDFPTIAVLGAVGPDKGARQLERLVALTRAKRVRVRFVLVGYMDVEHGPWQADDAVFTVHGRYEPGQLPQLLVHYRVRLVAFPSAGPETFSFTLSEAWAAGLPVVVPPFGALAERVGDSGAGWLFTEAEWRDEARMLERVAALVAPANAVALAAAARAARAVQLPSLDAMIERTAAHYDRAIEGGGSPGTSFHELADGGTAPPLRLTLAGRWLYRWAPKRMREAFKSRLR